jgi:hypothetical protein
MLSHKLDRARKGLSLTQKHFHDHCLYVGRKKQEKWKQMEKKALKERGEALDIYEIMKENGQSLMSFMHFSFIANI